MGGKLKAHISISDKIEFRGEKKQEEKREKQLKNIRSLNT